MTFLSGVAARAARLGASVAFAEAADERVLAAAQRVLDQQAEVIALVAPEAAVPEELKR